MVAQVKVRLWERVKAVEFFTAISPALGKPVGSIHSVVRAQGGIAPAVRHRASRALTRAEREAISRRFAAGASLRAMARQLGRAPSTISREIARNVSPVMYRALEADARAWPHATLPKVCCLTLNAALHRVVEDAFFTP